MSHTARSKATMSRMRTAENSMKRRTNILVNNLSNELLGTGSYVAKRRNDINAAPYTDI